MEKRMPNFVMNARHGSISAASLDGWLFVRINDDFMAENTHVEKLKKSFANSGIEKFTRVYLEKLGFKFDSLGPCVDLRHLADTGEWRWVF
jgi:hypothetical protein